MRFQLVDRLTEWTAGERLAGRKLLTLGEEYLTDHFPGFPVMPGVLMLQAVAEASAWLWRLTTDYAHSVIVLRETRGVKYGSFMKPGFALDLHTELTKTDPSAGTATFRCKGLCEGTLCVAATLTLAGYNLRDRANAREGDADQDAELIRHWKERFALLTR